MRISDLREPDVCAMCHTCSTLTKVCRQERGIVIRAVLRWYERLPRQIAGVCSGSLTALHHTLSSADASACPVLLPHTLSSAAASVCPVLLPHTLSSAAGSPSVVIPLHTAAASHTADTAAAPTKSARVDAVATCIARHTSQYGQSEADTHSL